MDFQSVTHPDDLPAELSALDRIFSGEIPNYRTEKRYLRKDGKILWADLRLAPAFYAERSPVYLVCEITDLTPRKKAEAQLVQARKMESIGQLTGGIAHDFNNLLTVIIGNLELAGRRAREDARVTPLLATAREAAERGAVLTKHLLGFSRRQALEPKTVSLGDELSGLEPLLRRTVGEAATLELVCAPDLWPIWVDPVALETAVLSLVVNARDFLREKGTISIVARNQLVDTSYAQMENLEPGDYVLLSVTDDGPGIPKEHLEQVIEPFFTTKELGQGSGLGLSMVYGFMKQSEGHLRIYSEEGIGATVGLYLPRSPAERTTEGPAVTPEAIPMAREGEKILLVEDHAEIRHLAASFLDELGYAVAQAESGKHALGLLEQDDDVDLVLSDVVMPGDVDGFELARAVADRFPGIPVVLASGYPGHRCADEGMEDAEILLKPYTLWSLGDRVRRALDGRPSGSSTR